MFICRRNVPLQQRFHHLWVRPWCGAIVPRRRSLFITKFINYHWILDAVWRASIQGWENIGSQAIMRVQMIFGIHKMEVETPFSCIDQSTSDKKWGIINDRINQIHMLLPKTSRHNVGARHIFSTNQQFMHTAPKSMPHAVFPPFHFDFQKRWLF